ncbi:unnamed protein product [Euphydryas editha]|uniref:Uncharacterized protein n=1 Tax=Euphydryas editha TaxID=104508 RepID=A0AAU9UL52_EUPED|nr:unnamed protein product [Euphydryas editha]
MYIPNMLFVTLFVLVSVVSGEVNSTEPDNSSRMAWIKGLLDHHEWINILNANHSLPELCENDLRQYVTALNQGQLWASKSKYKIL